LLCATRTEIEAFVECAWDYFGTIKGDQVLDRFSQENIKAIAFPILHLEAAYGTKEASSVPVGRFGSYPPG
jgi:hypothetical protein